MESGVWVTFALDRESTVCVAEKSYGGIEVSIGGFASMVC